jgi:hypothetical protein
MQQAVNRIRTEAQAQRVYPLVARRVVALDGTAAQAGVAARVIQELNSAAR